MNQLLGIVVGMVSGFVWEKLSTSPNGNYQTLFPSLIIKSQSISIHIHHWVGYALMLLVLVIWSVKTNRLSHPSVLMVAGFLVAALIYYYLKYPGWHNFIE